MAGNYMDAPSDRIAWDRDGSIGVIEDYQGNVIALTASQRRQWNSEGEAAASGLSPVIRKAAVVFAVPTDCVAVFFNVSRNDSGTWSIETSKDTTNGMDGTWDSQFITGLNPFYPTKPNYRISSYLFTLQDNSYSKQLRGIRFVYSNATYSNYEAPVSFHVYGTPAATAPQDRIAIWHPTSDLKVTPTHFDWGNVPRSSSADRSFRIKNLSSVKRAKDIDVYAEAITAGDPAVDSMHTFSTDGGATFSPSVNLVSLNPGATSGIIIVRRTVPANAQTSVWTARIAADVNLWEDA